MLTFSYSRVSTASQTTENQSLEITAAGYSPDHEYMETISGKVPAFERPEFSRMLETIKRTKKDKQLVVTKLDRLGRDASDILQTVNHLEALGCAVKVLQLGNMDLTSVGGKIVLATLSALAEVERDILVERTKVGLQRAKKEGKSLGRPRVTDKTARDDILVKLSEGVSVSQIARDHKISRATVIRIRDEGQCLGRAYA